MPELRGRLTPQGNLGGTLNTIVYASNYNVLDNKPSINSVTLQGNKTASDLGLAVPADITVTSVNGETGAVVLDGSDINYDVNTTVNSKLDDLQSQIDNSGVLAVNGKTGVVILTGTDINYSAGVTLNAKIDAVEAEIPTVNYPVTSVNGETGAVVLDGTDIKYDTNTTINAKIDAVEAEIPTVDYPVTSVNGETGTVVLDGTDINYDTNTTVNAKIDAVQGSIPTTDNDISHYTGTPTAGTTAEAIGAINTRLGTRLVGAWTADSSNANNTYLTDEITVGAGTYLIVMSYPDISTTTFVASLYNKTTSAVYDSCYMLANSLGTKCVLTAFSGTGKICIASAQSGACSFTNKARGGIRAIKLSNNY